MDDKIQSLEDNQVWKFMPLFPGSKKIPVRWSFDLKANAANGVSLFMAWFVEKGYKKIEDRHFRGFLPSFNVQNCTSRGDTHGSTWLVVDVTWHQNGVPECPTELCYIRSTAMWLCASREGVTRISADEGFLWTKQRCKITVSDVWWIFKFQWIPETFCGRAFVQNILDGYNCNYCGIFSRRVDNRKQNRVNCESHQRDLG